MESDKLKYCNMCMNSHIFANSANKQDFNYENHFNDENDFFLLVWLEIAI